MKRRHESTIMVFVIWLCYGVLIIDSIFEYLPHHSDYEIVEHIKL